MPVPATAPFTVQDTLEASASPSPSLKAQVQLSASLARAGSGLMATELTVGRVLAMVTVLLTTVVPSVLPSFGVTRQATT